MSKEKFVNPFKKGDLHNPAVSLEESRKRSSNKIKRMTGEFTGP
jgi:hypothetical protein